MTKKRLVLTFPTELLDQPVTYHLIKDYDLMVNILRANVTADEEGRLIIEITGDKASVDKGIKYLS
ncbi:MAG: (Fe-S)-binding protein, partial [Candidatus Omnitrophica bacterium]|nr:(Fe-S)-binding protein [Candidatus Omnitrophota bacterium]